MAVAMRRGVIVGDATEIVLSAVNATVEAGTATSAEEVRVRTGGFVRRADNMPLAEYITQVRGLVE
jgi:hypothetical protein